MADITFEDVLKFAEQLTSEERERLIEQFQAQGAKRQPIPPFHNECTVNNLEELFHIVFNEENIFSSSHDLFIFRGQADSAWRLVPSVFRRYNMPPSNFIEFHNNMADPEPFFKIARLQGLERNVYREFFERLRAYPQVRVNFHDPWEMLCLAQHFGVPTRLLDWTGNLNVAAYLCVSEKSYENTDGAIWCLNASLISVDRNPPRADDPFNGVYYDREERVSRIDDLPLPTSFLPTWEKREYLPEETAYGFRVLRAPIADDRIKNQDSFFTVDVTKQNIVDKPDDVVIHYDQIDLCKDYLLKIIIPADAKKSIKNDLERLGINYSMVFPDLFGLGKYFQDLREAFIPYWGGKDPINDS